MNQSAKNWFKDRTLLIATRHKKERVLAPLLEKELGVRCIVPFDFDTDQFGTFSGEILRKKDPFETLREKCLVASSRYHTDLVVASEGSFGAHPSSGFLTCNEELLLLKDNKHQLEIFEREISLTTNSRQEAISSLSELEDFARKCGFPEHGIMLKGSKPNELTKGITDMQVLQETFLRYHNDGEKVIAETDMRALYNPTRMLVIEAAAHKLVERILTCCPNCSTPGFGISAGIPGKPCQLCLQPTKSIQSYLYKCNTCQYKEEKPKPGSPFEDPTYCDFCNP